MSAGLNWWGQFLQAPSSQIALVLVQQTKATTDSQNSATVELTWKEKLQHCLAR